MAPPPVIPSSIQPKLKKREDAERLPVDDGKLTEFIAISGPKFALSSPVCIPGEATVLVVKSFKRLPNQSAESAKPCNGWHVPLFNSFMRRVKDSNKPLNALGAPFRCLVEDSDSHS